MTTSADVAARDGKLAWKIVGRGSCSIEWATTLIARHMAPERAAAEKEIERLKRADTNWNEMIAMLSAMGNERLNDWTDANKLHIEALLTKVREVQTLQARIAELEADNARLAAIVERLPKTADGVPITPGMKLWHPDQVTQRCIYPFEADGVWLVDVPTKIGPDNFVCQSSHENATECYSTPQAAEAAKEGA